MTPSTSTLMSVVEPVDSSRKTQALKTVPPLPNRLTNTWPAVLIGTALWLAGLVVSFIFWLASDRPPNIWLWTTLAGVAISALGMGIMSWQHYASRKRDQSVSSSESS